VALFVDRARAVRHDFALTRGNAAAVVEICRRLEGLPLAIELAAARTRLLDPDALLRRLNRSLDALGTGTADLPERQHTLRATVEWSVGLLEDAERSLLETVAVFVDGWTVEAAARVAGLVEDRALEGTETLAGHSLIYLDRTEHGPRCRMLDTVRAFVAERLAGRADVAEIRRRHADYYRALAEHADARLRSFDQDEWAERLEAEAGNLAAAVRWYLANDRTPLPHLFRVLWMYWGLRDHLGEARAWVEQLLGAADSLDVLARAELLWTAAVTALEVVGDDSAALAARDRLAPLLPEIEDPFLHAVSELTIAGISAAVGDFEGALREVLASLEELHRLDEPFWTAVAASTAGVEEMVEGRYDDALRHLTEVRDLGERFDSAGLTAGSRVQLGTLAIVRGRLDEARALLDEGLDLSLAAHTNRNVSLCLSAFALLVFVEGDPERPRWWRGRPRACAGAPPWACGRCCGAGRPRWLPRSAWRWARTGSARCSPPAPGSASGRRWPPSATVPAPRRRDASGFRRQSGGRG
jgi:tetratricopeptide (TPR) repeat protein